MSDFIAWYIVLSVAAFFFTAFNFIIIQAISEIFKLTRIGK